MKGVKELVCTHGDGARLTGWRWAITDGRKRKKAEHAVDASEQATMAMHSYTRHSSEDKV